jgi:hypothetical protein
MAAKKTTAKKKKNKNTGRRRARVRYARRLRFRDPVHRKWNLWRHDLDTLLHQLVRNPALVDVRPHDLIKRAVEFADSYHSILDARRPPSMDPSDEF